MPYRWTYNEGKFGTFEFGECKLGHNVKENIIFAERKLKTQLITKQLLDVWRNFHLGFKIHDDQVKSGRPQIVDFKYVQKAIESNSVSSSQGVSGEFNLL